MKSYLKNRQSLIDDIVTLMVEADVRAARPGHKGSTDIDLVYDAETETGILEEHWYTGRRMWPTNEKRDVITIWTKDELGAIDLYDWYCDAPPETVSYWAKKSLEELKRMAKDENADVWDIVAAVIDDNGPALEGLLTGYRETVREYYIEYYREAAEKAIDEWMSNRETR